MKIALTIAGSDPSGGAGIQADLKTFHQHGVYGTAVISVITVQGTRSPLEASPLEPRLVRAQIEAVLDDLSPDAVKTGALGRAELVEVVAEKVEGLDVPLVVDPVFRASSGPPLLDEQGIALLQARLLPHAALVTPNIAEAERLSGRRVRDLDGMGEAARAIAGDGARAVLVTGGGDDREAIDLLLSEGVIHLLRAERVHGPDPHGTGCALSAAITASLAKGIDLIEAVERGKEFVTRAIQSMTRMGDDTALLNHHAEIPEGARIRGEGSAGAVDP